MPQSQIGLTLVCGVAWRELLSHHPSSFPSHPCLVPTGLVSVRATGNTGDVWFVWSHFFSIHLVWHLGLLAYVVLSINSLVTEVWALRKACSQIWQRSAVWWSKENTVGTFSKFLMFSFCVNWQSTAVSVSDSGDWTWTGGERHPTMTASWVQRHWKYVSSAAAHWDINFSKWLGGGQDNLLFWGHSSEPPLVSF